MKISRDNKNTIIRLTLEEFINKHSKPLIEELNNLGVDIYDKALSDLEKEIHEDQLYPSILFKTSSQVLFRTEPSLPSCVGYIPIRFSYVRQDGQEFYENHGPLKVTDESLLKRLENLTSGIRQHKVDYDVYSSKVTDIITQAEKSCKNFSQIKEDYPELVVPDHLIAKEERAKESRRLNRVKANVTSEMSESGNNLEKSAELFEIDKEALVRVNRRFLIHRLKGG